MGTARAGTGILNNRSYAGEIVWGRSTWKRSAADSKQRKWSLSEDAQVVTRLDERLRIVPQALWDAVKARQGSIEGMTVKLRGVLKHKGVLPAARALGAPELPAVRRDVPAGELTRVRVCESR